MAGHIPSVPRESPLNFAERADRALSTQAARSVSVLQAEH